jgi:integrase
VTITSRTPSLAARKKPPKPGLDRRHGEPIIEATYFEEVTTAQVADFITAKVRNRGLAPKTANHYRQILVRLFNWAINESGIKLPIDKNPAAPVKKYRENAPEIRFLTLTQIDEQLAALADHPQLQTMVALYIYAGVRREEALWLTLDDIDLNIPPYGNIRVQAKTLRGDRWQPKTRVNRGVPISSDLRAWLDRYTPRPSVGSFYFPSPDGKHWDPDNFSQDLAAANAKAGLPWTCLDFRHTFGSHLAMKGQSLYKIATLMGNSPEICRRHYAALMPESLTGSVEFRRDAVGTVRPGQGLQIRNA